MLGVKKTAVEIGDPAIKLFGRTILLTPLPAAAEVDQQQDSYKSTDSADSEEKQSQVTGPSSSSESKEAVASEAKKKEGRSNKPTPMQKLGKAIPCARCSSMDTKFCYYNNYNINQPRHFCKRCQRYWTSGGSMRNIPIGAGRRKSKSCYSATPVSLRAAGGRPFPPPPNLLGSMKPDDSLLLQFDSSLFSGSHGWSPFASPLAPCLIPAAWSIPWLAAVASASSSSALLGKHSGEKMEEHHKDTGDDGERRLWIPKAMRIGDLEEESRSRDEEDEELGMA